MQHHTAILVAILVVASQSANAQSIVEHPQRSGTGLSPFVAQIGPIPEGHWLHLSAAFPPYETRTDFAYGNISVVLGGLFRTTFAHERVIGSPIGALKPTNLLGFQLQVIPHRGQLPAVSVFLIVMTGTQSESLADIDLKPNLPMVFERGLLATSYEAKSSLAGVDLSSAVSDRLSFNIAVGARQIVWRQAWSRYAFDTGLPRTQDGWTFPLAERNSLRLDMSASISFRPLQELTLIGEITSLPFMDVDPSSLVIQDGQGYMGSIGVRYSLPIPLNIDLYDRWYSQNGPRSNYHQVRLGLSTDILLQ